MKRTGFLPVLTYVRSITMKAEEGLGAGWLRENLMGLLGEPGNSPGCLIPVDHSLRRSPVYACDGCFRCSLDVGCILVIHGCESFLDRSFHRRLHVGISETPLLTLLRPLYRGLVFSQTRLLSTVRLPILCMPKCTMFRARASRLLMGFSTPSSGKATGASPLRASLRSVLPSVPQRNYWDLSAPPQASALRSLPP